MSNTVKTQVKLQMGRVEFLANKEEIQDLLSKGHTAMSIFHTLKNKNRISVSYHTLKKYMCSLQKQTAKVHTTEKNIIENKTTEPQEEINTLVKNDNTENTEPQTQEGKRALKEPEPRFGEVKKPFKEKF